MPVRDTFWNIPVWAKTLLYVTNILGILILTSRFYLRTKEWAKGQGKLPFDRLPERFGRVFQFAIAQTKIARKYTARFHIPLFVAFIIFFIGTSLVAVDEYHIAEFFLGFELLQGTFYLIYEAVLDTFLIVGLVMLGIALARRYFAKPNALTYSFGFQAMLWILFIDLLSGLAIETFRLAAVQPDWQIWSYAGYAMSRMVLLFDPSMAFLETAHLASWVFHFSITALIYAVFLDLPLKHIIYSPLNIFFSSFKERGALAPLDLEDETVETFGVGAVSDLHIIQLLDGDACTECGRCQEVCPAFMAGTPLNPKQVILDIRTGIDEMKTADGSAVTLTRDIVSDAALWACTTCRACVHECPVLIEHVDSIVDMRRHMVLMEGDMPDLLGMAMQQAERAGNPWGNPRGSRMDWADGLDVPVMAQKKSADVLYWLGCAGSYDPESQQTSRAVVKIFEAAGIDYAVLGEEERCNCEWARRGGNEYLYQEATHSNIAVFDQYEFKTIVTHCPHCFNTFANEYPQFGGEYDVIHHTTYIMNLIENGHLKLDKTVNELVTYHDSCYLGRYNDIYEEPRDVLASAGIQLTEMPRSRDKGLCCGGGGAQVWFETHQEIPVSEIRLSEAMETGADTVGTACPFCTIMLGSAAQTQGVTEDVRVTDISVIIADSIR